MIVALLAIGQTWFARGNAGQRQDCLQNLSAATQITTVHIQPDDGHKPVLDEITNARCSIDLSMYLLSDEEILAALSSASVRGVEVRVILEQQPFNTYGGQEDIFSQLQNVGIQVVWSPSTFTFTHAKYMVIDDQVLIVTNQNFTGSGFASNREFGVVTTDRNLVTQAAAVFEADWSGQTDVVGISTLIVSPINSRARILELINGAKESVWLYAEVLRDEQITQALDNAADRGVDVRVIVNPTADEEDVPYFLDAMSHGVQVRTLDKPYVHAKAILIDGSRALIGSQNYSSTSLDQNRELGMILTEAGSIKRIERTYLQDWSRATPVDGVSGVATSLTRSGVIGRISSGRWGVV